MPKFHVEKGHDAWVRYAAVIEAETADEAEMIAAEQHRELDWQPSFTSEFDDWEIMKGDTTQVDDDFLLEPAVEPIYLTVRERDIVIAGLRAYQDLYTMTAGDMPEHLVDIAENGRDGEDAALSLAQINDLCEWINS